MLQDFGTSFDLHSTPCPTLHCSKKKWKTVWLNIHYLSSMRAGNMSVVFAAILPGLSTMSINTNELNTTFHTALLQTPETILIASELQQLLVSDVEN